MAAGGELVELRFRLADGSDIGPSKYDSSATVTSLKEKIIAQWPKGKENGPKSINDIKLINAGRILENNRTLAESRLPLSEVPGGVITMHVVVRPPIPDKNSECWFRCFILVPDEGMSWRDINKPDNESWIAKGAKIIDGNHCRVSVCGCAAL